MRKKSLHSGTPYFKVEEAKLCLSKSSLVMPRDDQSLDMQSSNADWNGSQGVTKEAIKAHHQRATLWTSPRRVPTSDTS